MYENPVRTDLARNEFVLKGGYADIYSKPGLGVAINKDKILKYCV